MKHTQSGNIKIIISVLLAVVLIGAAALGAWYYQQRTVNELEQHIGELNEHVQFLQNQKQTESTSQDETQTRTSQPTYAYTSQKGVDIEVYVPRESASVTSPVAVIGQAPGSWAFEADFPLELQDGNGNTVAETPAQVHGKWRTEELVPFTAELTYTNAPATGMGTLVLHKANPGPPENDDKLTIPVTF